MLYFINEIINTTPYKLTLKFNTGEIKIINLEKKIKARSKTESSKYKALLDPDYFNSVKLQPEWETIYWDNGLDFCPDVLYNMGKSI
ncbi:MAG: DUF2442 domain-containing protein [Bacteroidia bacterium]|nr:DUF2442 domain-containing protein [Bacteroidia bacterium]